MNISHLITYLSLLFLVLSGCKKEKEIVQYHLSDSEVMQEIMRLNPNSNTNWDDYLYGTHKTSLAHYTPGKRLQSLHLSNLNIDTLPPSIKYLTRLRNLDLRGNKKVRLPIEITELKRLESLDLTNTALDSIPTFLFEMNHLLYCYLDSNNISRIDTRLHQMKKLLLVTLSNNKIRYLPSLTIPDSSLVYFYIDYNQIEYIPLDFINNLKKCRKFSLNNNKIHSIPQGIECNALGKIYLNNNRLKRFPKFILKCSEIYEVNLIGNPIDSIPQEAKVRKELCIITKEVKRISCPCPHTQ